MCLFIGRFGDSGSDTRVLLQDTCKVVAMQWGANDVYVSCLVRVGL